MKYFFIGMALALSQFAFCQKYLLDRKKLDPPNSVSITKGIRLTDSTSFLVVKVTRLDTLKDEQQGKAYQLYHLEIGNFSDTPVCIPVAHFGNHLFKESVLVLENPFNQKVDFVNLEDCYHDGNSHVCPFDGIVINPNTYFNISFGLDVSQVQFQNVHFDYALVVDGYFAFRAKMAKGSKWKKDLQFKCKTIKLP